MDTELMGAGLQVMIFGLGGVFSVLILFYFSTKIMVRVAQKMNDKKLKDNA